MELFNLIRVYTQRCIYCGNGGWVEMTYPQYAEGQQHLRDGWFVQDAFPFLSAGEREMLITGTHPECWDAMMGDDQA
jgi:hypothetical protein